MKLPSVPAELLRFAKFEQVLAAALLVAPAIMWAFDGDTPRDSVSAYHEMSPPVAYFYPLTALAMLFFVNGALKRAHWYNIVLGAALSGVLFMDHDGGSRPYHLASAAVFYLSSALVVLLGSKHVSKRLAVTFTSLVAFGAVSFFLFSPFWAEWIGMGIYALHFILDSVSDSISPYEAVESGEPSDAELKLKGQERVPAAAQGA